MSPLIDNQGFLYTFTRDKVPGDIERKNKLERSKNKKEIILVLIADDHPYLIHGVEADLNKDPAIKIVGTAHSYDELIEKAVKLEPNLILMDLKMPGQEKHDLKHCISALHGGGHCKIVIFSNEAGWARIHRCLELGASAYIEKAISIGNLANLINTVFYKDEIVIYTAEKLPRIQFPKRQKEILHFVADGKENDEIALSLNIEIKTVQSYLNEIKEKMSRAFGISPIRPRTLLLLASKLGFGSRS